MDVDLRARRVAAGLTQVQLARMAGVSQAKLSEYERGVTRPKPETLDRILASARLRPSVELERHADEVRDLARKFRLGDVRVFGSAVHGTDTTSSDIDLLVTAGEGATLFDVSAFESAVAALTGYPVDVVTSPAPASPIWSRILAESVPL